MKIGQQTNLEFKNLADRFAQIKSNRAQEEQRQVNHATQIAIPLTH